MEDAKIMRKWNLMNCSHTFAILYTCDCYTLTYISLMHSGEIFVKLIVRYIFMFIMCAPCSTHTTTAHSAHTASDRPILNHQLPFTIRTFIVATARLFSPAIRIQESNLLFSLPFSFFFFALLSLHATYLYGMLKNRFVQNMIFLSEEKDGSMRMNEHTR